MYLCCRSQPKEKAFNSDTLPVARGQGKFQKEMTFELGSEKWDGLAKVKRNRAEIEAWRKHKALKEWYWAKV